MKENTMATNFEPHERVTFLRSTKIGTQENKAIHSISQIEYQLEYYMYLTHFSI